MKTNKWITAKRWIFMFGCLFLLAACSQSSDILLPLPSEGSIQPDFIPNHEKTTTPFMPAEELPLPSETASPQPSDLHHVSVPPGYLSLFTRWSEGLEKKAVVDQNAACQLGVVDQGLAVVEWILALVTPFNTIPDGMDGGVLENYLQNNKPMPSPFKQLVTTQTVLDVLIETYPQAFTQIVVVPVGELPAYLYEHPQTLGLVPFEALTPALKVMRIDQVSPYDQDFDPSDYFFTIRLGFDCKPPAESFISAEQPTWTNRDAAKFTSVLLTGTTALTRATGHKMEMNGNQYPGEKIKDWFDAADISHISNEVSYSVSCPLADPFQKDLLFCGRPEYVELFTYLGVDVIELTGNHLADKGVPPLTEMMALFHSLALPYYAAGADATAAAQPVYFETNGNRIAFLGCNAAGPSFVYATAYRAGVNECDLEAMANQVAQLVEAGYLPIVTFQYWESFQFDPMPYQRKEFRAMIEAGAVVVSGSQAHLPMTMEVYQQGFIHYGLGNLFFDQMDLPVVGTRREFLDRHIFYDGRYLGVDLLTAMLEDYAQPRPMTAAERESLLFDAYVDFKYVPESPEN